MLLVWKEVARLVGHGEMGVEQPQGEMLLFLGFPGEQQQSQVL